jgi:cell division inhibitor SulA/protein ImuA
MEDLTSHPGIWRGFAVGNAFATDAVLSTGFAELDAYLPGGGWPLPAITEIFLDRYGVGELSLLMPALAGLSRSAAQQWIVWIAPPFVPYAPALSRCGIDLGRVLLVHPTRGRRDVAREAFPRGSSIRGMSKHDVTKRKVSKRDVLWAIEQAIRSKASLAVLAWLAAADHAALRRLQLSAEEHRCWTVLFRPATAMEQSSPAALRMKLLPAVGRARVDVVKCRGRRPQTIVLDNVYDPCGSGRVEWP